MTAVSQPGYFNLQQMTDLGALAALGRIYTYAFGTTTQKTAYTDSDGLVAHTYTSDGIGGSYIALNARGELPAPLYLTPGAYDIAYKTAAGATVWTRRADPVTSAAVSSFMETVLDDTTAVAARATLAAPVLLATTYYSAGASYAKAVRNPVYIEVEIWGAGGGGGACAAAASYAGGGGAGGCSRKRILNAALGASETITIGAGGVAGNDVGPTAGSTGSTSSFGAHCSATGGSGGAAAPSSNVIYSGGNGGTGSGGDLNLVGEIGRSGVVASSSGSAGGGGTTTLGGNAAGASSAVGGAATANSGSGGGGGGNNGATARSGGMGGSGFCIVREYG